ncbi:hypothetical protein [Sporomusa sp.]|uniref:hypothetical protein n=1 Tax=Sporomusa sp. TaxID=2078658 RepID=UPI002CCFF134|nr:hypothetical protein [Sporomusa sp.]HWR43254.1 hypothetical protein [Sporomusa sp.]
MKKSAEKLEQQINASVGYGPNNPEPLSFKESEIPKDKDALHSASEYIDGNNTTPTVNPTGK